MDYIALITIHADSPNCHLYDSENNLICIHMHSSFQLKKKNRSVRT